MGFLNKLFRLTKTQPTSDDNEITKCFIDTLASSLGMVNDPNTEEVKTWNIENRFIPEIQRRNIAIIQFLADLKSALDKKGYSIDINPSIFTDNKESNLSIIIEYVKSNAKNK